MEIKPNPNAIPLPSIYSKEKRKIPMQGILGITLLSDVIYRVVSNPFWICQNRIIKHIRKNNFGSLKSLRISHILKQRVQEEGLRSLFTGTVNFIGAGMLKSGIYFPLYEMGK